MRKNRRFIIGSPGGQKRYVHVISLTAGKEILFGDDKKETFRTIHFNC